MQLGKYINLNELACRLVEGTVAKRLHPRWPLAILNYTQTAMGRTHDDETLRLCRGLIYNTETMEIVARPPEAFFNVNDERYPETQVENLPKDCRVEITEKMDGSLGIIYQYQNNLPEVATRGSFESEQAKWATSYLQGRLPSGINLTANSHYTYIVEIIYPGNQIVVDYGAKSDLTLLAVINTETGEEFAHEPLTGIAEHLGLPLVKLYDKAPCQCVAENEKNREGYVSKFFMHDGSVRRVKIKFEDYRTAHKAMFGMNTRDVWAMARDSGWIPEASLSLCSLDFQNWFTSNYLKFRADFVERKRRVLSLVAKIHEMEVYRLESLDDPRIEYACKWTRKSSADFLTRNAGDLFSACFSCYDGKDYEAVIWKTLRPVKAEGCKGRREE